METSASPARLHLAVAPEKPVRAGKGWGDVGLLLFVVALHAPPLVARAAGTSWGTGAEGYATLVVLLAGRELGRELRDRARRLGAVAERCP